MSNIHYSEIENVLETFEDDNLPNGIIHALRIGENVWFPADEICRIVRKTPTALTRMAGSARTREIDCSTIVDHPRFVGPEDYVRFDFVKTLLKDPYDGWGGYTPLKNWVKRDLLGSPSLIKSGAWVGAHQLHRLLGVGNGFGPWAREVSRRNRKATRGTGFLDIDVEHNDFPVPLNLAETLAREAQSYGGLLVSYAISGSNFYTSTLLRKPFAKTLESLSDIFPNHLGLVDAHGLGEELDFDPTVEYRDLARSMDGELESAKGIHRDSATLPGRVFYSASDAKVIVATWEDQSTALAIFKPYFFRRYYANKVEP